MIKTVNGIKSSQSKRLTTISYGKETFKQKMYKLCSRLSTRKDGYVVVGTTYNLKKELRPFSK